MQNTFKVMHYLIMVWVILMTSCEQANDSANELSDEVDTPITCDDGYRISQGMCVLDTGLDEDFDGVPDELDNCPAQANADQTDCDLDGLGDVCDDEVDCGLTIAGLVERYDPLSEETTPILGARLMLEGTSFVTQSDEEGQYQLFDVYPGTHTLLIFAPEEIGVEPELLGRYVFDLVNEGEVVRMNWLINPPGDLLGSIKRNDLPEFSTLNDGIGVYLKEIPFAKTVTDVRGRFELRGVPEGDYTLRAVYPGYGRVDFPVTVFSLARSEVNQQRPLMLTHQSSVDWEHEVQVTVRELEPSSEVEFTIQLVPLFPHLSEPTEIRYQGMTNEEGMIRVSQLASHQGHDVYNLVLTEHVKQVSSYHLDATADEITFTEVMSERLPNDWVNYDDLTIPPMTVDLESTNEPQQLLTEVGDGSLPLGVANQLGDRWTLFSVAGNRQKEELVIEARLAPLRYLLSHKYKEAASSITRSMILSYDSNGLSEGETEVNVAFSLTTSEARSEIGIALTPKQCQPSDDCELQSQILALENCTPTGLRSYDCTVSLQLDSSHSEMRLWLYERFPEQEFEFYTECGQCLSTEFDPLLSRGIEFFVPIYSLLARDLYYSEENECIELDIEGFAGVEPTRVIDDTEPSQEFCFPNPPLHTRNQVTGCIPAPLPSPSGRPLMITDAVAVNTTGSYLRDRIIPENFYGTVQVNYNEHNPLLEYRRGVCMQGCLTDVFEVEYTLTDGVNSSKHSLRFMQLSSDQSGYCWNIQVDSDY